MDHPPGSLHMAATVQPAIAELLRTCVHPPVLNLRIDHIVRKEKNNDHDQARNVATGRSTKLFLTDGQLLIQGLLHHKLCTLPEIEKLDVGDIVEIHDFVVRKARRNNGQGHVVYLGIENCYVIKAEERARDILSTDIVTAVSRTSRGKRGVSVLEDQESDVTDSEAGGFLRDDVDQVHDHKRVRSADGGVQSVSDQKENKLDQTLLDKRRFGLDPDHDKVESLQPTHIDAQATRTITAPKFQTPAKPEKSMSQRSDSDEDEVFETIRVDLDTVRKRRQVLHELSQNVVTSSSRPSTRDSHLFGIKGSDSFQNPGRQSIVRFERNESDLRSDPGEFLAKSSSSSPLNRRLSPRGHRHYQFKDPEAHAISEDSELPFKSDRPAPPSQALLKSTTPIHIDAQSQADGPLKSLVSLYSPSLPSKSFVFTTIIIPTYVAPYLISRPNSPFPPKRHIKVIDPSLAAKLNLTVLNMRGKGITVSVYRNAASFKPTVGRAALMRGVVMQRLNNPSQTVPGTTNMEVILNVYPEKLKTQKQSNQQWNQQDQHLISRQDNSYENNLPTLNPLVDDNLSAHKTNTGRTKPENPVTESFTKQTKISSANHDAHLDESHWFIDDHDTLRKMGYNVTGVQRWWDRMLASN